jgi:glycosyltransferase involved in cell wall biosynthesis
MTMPLVSVIMPVKNGEPFLRQAIASILQQEYPSLELIVVDGQSTDATAQIVQSFCQVRYIFQEVDPGIPHAKNLGIRAAKGEFVAFASHDDLWHPSKLRNQIDYMTRRPEIQYTITRVRFFKDPDCPIPAGFRKEFLEGDHIGKMPETLVARKALFDSIGEFDTRFHYMEDIDWFNRASLMKIPMAVVEQTLLFKRVHGANTSYNAARIETINREILQILRLSVDRHHSDRRGRL